MPAAAACASAAARWRGQCCRVAAEGCATELERAKQAARTSKRGCVGGTARAGGEDGALFDIDIVAGVVAELLAAVPGRTRKPPVGRVPAAMPSVDLASFFRVRDVPEVFAHFDEFS